MINGLVTTTTDTGAVTNINVMTKVIGRSILLVGTRNRPEQRLSLFYYLRIGLLMFFEEPVE